MNAEYHQIKVNPEAVEKIWEKTRLAIMKRLKATIYEPYLKNAKADSKDSRKEKGKIAGLIIDVGNPHEPALLLTPQGNLQLVQYGWSPRPSGEGKLSDIEFCLRATEVFKNPPKRPKRLLKM